MKKTVLIAIFFLFLGLRHSSSYDFSANILDGSDYLLEERDQMGPRALGSLLNDGISWESFNHWQCFPTQNIEIECAEADYGKIVKIPNLSVFAGSRRIDFSMDPEPAPDCEKIAKRWGDLLAGESEFCVYAAFLQTDGENPRVLDEISNSLWIASRLKSMKGTWSAREAGNWPETEWEDDSETDLYEE